MAETERPQPAEPSPSAQPKPAADPDHVIMTRPRPGRGPDQTFEGAEKRRAVEVSSPQRGEEQRGHE